MIKNMLSIILIQ